jgi:phage-related protein
METKKKDTPVFVLVLFIDRAHERSGRGQDLVDKDEDGLLRGQLDALADDIDELTDCQIRRHQILLFVDCRNVAFLNLLADDGDAV